MDARNQRQSIPLMDAGRIERSIRRIAFNLAEEYHRSQSITLLGLNTRGLGIAHRLQSELNNLLPHPGHVAQIECESGEVTTNAEASILNHRTVICVDDVIFSGRTMQKAVMHVMSNFNPDIIRCVALIDRGHRKFPVEPQFTGLVCPTKLLEHVHVDLKPESDIDQVLLYHDMIQHAS